MALLLNSRRCFFNDLSLFAVNINHICISFLLNCLAELLNSSLFNIKVSEVFINYTIPPCLAGSVQLYESHIGFVFALSYFHNSFL